jgi:hypothetical protein
MQLKLAMMSRRSGRRPWDGVRLRRYKQATSVPGAPLLPSRVHQALRQLMYIVASFLRKRLVDMDVDVDSGAMIR